MTPKSLFRRTLLTVGMTLGLAVAVSACSTTGPPPASHSVTVVQPGPAKRPHAKAVWVKGHYVYRNGKYEWIPGHWKRR